MNYLNGILLIFLFAGGGLFFTHAARQKDHSGMLLASSVVTLGIAEIFALLLNIEFSPLALKNWYFMSHILFWGLLGTSALIKLSQIAAAKWKVIGSVVLALIIAWGLVQITQITGAVDWYAPDISIDTQYVDLLARNRPTRWLTNLFILYGLGASLLFAGHAIIQKQSQRFAYLLVALSSIFLAAQEYIYTWAGEPIGDILHLLSRLILFLTVLFLFQRAQENRISRSKIISISTWTGVLLILLLGANFRLNIYGDICKAVLTYDSQMFLRLSSLDIFSLDFFTSNRPAFITLIYKLVGVNSNMILTGVSSPTEGIIAEKLIHNDLYCLSGWQTMISIFSWSAFALIFSSKLRSNGLKIISAILILSFAYVPQLAAWDSLILSESISFSMFILTFGLSIELITRIVSDKKDIRRTTWGVFLLWGVTVALWGFSRDTNVYMLLLMGVSSLLVLLLPTIRNKYSVRAILLIAFMGLTLFGVQNKLLYRSDRWINSFFNNLTVHILPYPERQAWFVERGLPTPKPLFEIVNLYSKVSYQAEIAELENWTIENGSGMYTQYLLTHPGWTLSYFWETSPFAFSENIQPFFRTSAVPLPPALLSIGNILHPKTRAVVWVQLAILLSMIGLVVYRKPSSLQLGTLIVVALFFVGELGLLFVSLHGDALGIVRHALVSVMPLRLNIWVLSILFLDASLPISTDKHLT